MIQNNLLILLITHANRCAAMLAYGRKIVILPFRREANAPAEDPDR